MTEGKEEVRELPKGWVLTTVKETIKIIDYRGRTPPYSENGVPHLRSSNIRNRKIVWENLRYVSEETYQAYMTRGLPEKGDVLFTTEAPLGEVALAPEQRFSLAQRMMILRPIKDLLLSKFLLYQIENEDFQRKLSKSGTGTTVTGVSSRNFQPTPIILAPLNEQNRIVEKIEELFSELDQGIESLKTTQKQLKVYRQAVLKWAFEGKLTEEWRKQHQSTLKTGEALLTQIKAERENRYQQQLAEWETAVKEWEAIGKVGRKPTKPQNSKDFSLLTQSENSNLPKLSDGWGWERAGNIFSEINNGHTPTKEKLNPSSGEVPFLKVYNLTHNGSLDFKDLTFIARETHKLELTRSIVYPDDVLFNIVGPPLGKVSLVPPEYSEYNINQAVVVFRPNKRYLAKFLMYALLTRSVITWILSTGKATAGQTNLKVSSCREQPLPVCSTEEQERIVEEIESRLSICDQLEATIIENLQKAEALRQSILKQAFEGKLVPQDPNDEPAETLLDRIQAERQVNGNTGKKSKPSHQQLTFQEL